MAVTLADIAKHTGYSISSVSAALKGNRSTAKVSEAKKKEILDASQRLGYRPYHAARTLKIGKTTVLGMVIGEIHTPYYGEMTSMLMEEAEKHGYSIQIYVTNWEQERMQKAINLLLGGRCDGIILFGTGICSNCQEYIKKNKVPIVSLSGPISGMAYVDQEWDCSFTEIAEYLLSRGTSGITFIGDNVTSFERPKMKSLKQVFDKHKFNLNLVECHNKPKLVYDFGRNFKKTDAAPQIILTENDTLATVLIKALYDAGIKVPEEVSVIGCNDTDFSKYTTPALTTIGFDKKNYVKACIDLILKIINEKKVLADAITFPTFLVKRDSA